jgi:hypothetical protein
MEKLQAQSNMFSTIHHPQFKHSLELISVSMIDAKISNNNRQNIGTKWVQCLPSLPKNKISIEPHKLFFKLSLPDRGEIYFSELASDNYIKIEGILGSK